MEPRELYTRPMLDRNEQPLFYTPGEYIRRREAVIREMKAQNVSLLLIGAPCEEAYAAWLANDLTCNHLLLDDRGEVTLVYGSGFQEGNIPARPERTVMGRIGSDQIPGIRMTAGIDLNYVLDRIGADGRLGVINWRYLPAPFCAALEAKRPDLQWVDLRIPVCLLRATRSREEQDALARTADMEKKLFEAAPLFIREGRYPRDIIRDFSFYARELGAGRDECAAFFLECGYENDGGPLPRTGTGMQMYCDRPERIRPGYKLLLMLEMNRYGGMILDTGRTFSLGEPHPETKRVYDCSAQVQAFVASKMKPGAIPSQIEREAAAYAKELNIHMLSWNLLHGMGNTRTEAPDLRDPTTIDLPLRENMHLLCEPNTCLPFGDPKNPSYDFFQVVVLPNTYLVTPQGGKPMVDFPTKIIVL